MIWALGIFVFLILLILLISYICFRLAFFVSKKERIKNSAKLLPDGEIYLPYKSQILKWGEETKALPHQEFSIVSFDGTRLFAKYYEYKKGSPIELMFHGYKGTAERDLSGGVQRCFALGRSAFIVDQRTSGKSGGNVITFGIKEHKDCLCWIDFMIKQFGDNVKIHLTGISMGASTVLMAAGEDLPKNVVGVLADCGFSSAKDIIKKVIREMGLPENLAYPFVKLGALIYGGFNLEEKTSENSLRNCTVPVIFFHGDTDDFVPSYMSEINYNACSSKKRLVIIKGAGHGLCYLVEPDTYISELNDFYK